MGDGSAEGAAHPMNTFPFLDKVTRMLQLALGERLAPGVADYLDLFHEDAVFEFPSAPGGVHLKGKARMAAYLRTVEGGITFDSFTLKAVYPVVGGETVVLEYDSVGHDSPSGKLHLQSYVAVVRLVGGRLSLIREYVIPREGPS